MANTREKIFSVSEYIGTLNIGLKKSRARIIGEVGKIDIWPTGHISFPLRDERDQSIINCIIWKFRYEMFDIDLKEGLQIIVTGYPEIYSANGRLSIIAEAIEYAGEGKLKQEYEKLKNKLTKEGIFEESKKRPVPEYAQKIGVITSLKGAVIADFSSNLKKHGFKVKIMDSRVEGQTAVPELLLAIKSFRKKDIDVLIVIRGGGSMESMMAFNNEMLVREIVNFQVPVLVGIGHHKDEPLVALAADLSVSTPTATAQKLNESWERAELFLQRYKGKIITSYEDVLQNTSSFIGETIEKVHGVGNMIFEKYKKAKNKIEVVFQNFKNNLFNTRRDFNNLFGDAISGFQTMFFETDIDQELEICINRFSSSFLKTRRDLQNLEKNINHNNPERQLNLGYSIASVKGKIIRNTDDVKLGEDFDLKLKDGVIVSKIKNINKI
jgi:exodeoxyribonuclease VII large subunit